ncbi:hypothetical protein MKX03_017376, partial [Papaver bracteatum]
EIYPMDLVKGRLTVQIWDVGSGRLKLTLTYRASLAVNTQHTYMFSSGDDKQVKWWDLEQNKWCLLLSYSSHHSGHSMIVMFYLLEDVTLFVGCGIFVQRCWPLLSLESEEQDVYFESRYSKGNSPVILITQQLSINTPPTKMVISRIAGRRQLKLIYLVRMGQMEKQKEVQCESVMLPFQSKA